MGEPAEPLTRTSGGGWVAVMGIPLFLGGASVVIAAFAHPPLPDSWTNTGGGILMLLAGAAMFLFRYGWTLDPRKRTLVKWWGLLRPLSSTTRSWDDFSEVSLVHNVTLASESNTRQDQQFIVSLTGAAGESLKLAAPAKRPPAIELAKQVAALMGLGLRDSSRGPAVWREAGSLEKSLRAYYHEKGEKPTVPDPAADFRGKLKVDSCRLILEVPARVPLLENRVVLAALASAIALVLALTFYLNATAVIGWAQTAFSDGFVGTAQVISALAALIILPGLWSWGGELRRKLTSSRLTISPLSIEVKTIASTRQVPLEKVIEVEVISVGRPPPMTWLGDGQVEIRSDAEVITFGPGLSLAELKWVSATIHSYLAS